MSSLPQYWVSSAVTLCSEPLYSVFCVGVPNEDCRFYVIATDKSQARLHWGVGVCSVDAWEQPPSEWLPPYQPSTTGSNFVSTPFVISFPLADCPDLSSWFDNFREGEALNKCHFVIFKWSALLPKIKSIVSVLHLEQTNQWIKRPNAQGNFVVDIAALEADEREAKVLNEWELRLSQPLTPDVSSQWSIVSNQRRFLLKAKAYVSECLHASSSVF